MKSISGEVGVAYRPPAIGYACLINSRQRVIAIERI